MKYLIILTFAFTLWFSFNKSDTQIVLQKKVINVDSKIISLKQKTKKQKVTHPIINASETKQSIFSNNLNLGRINQEELNHLRNNTNDLAKEKDQEFRTLMIEHLQNRVLKKPLAGFLLVESHIQNTRTPELAILEIFALKSKKHRVHGKGPHNQELNLVKSFALDNYFERIEKQAEEASPEIQILLQGLAKAEPDLMLVRDSLQHLARHYDFDGQQIKELVKDRDPADYFAYQDLI